MAKFKIITPSADSFTMPGAGYELEMEALQGLDAEIVEVSTKSEDDFISAAFGSRMSEPTTPYRRFTSDGELQHGCKRTVRHHDPLVWERHGGLDELDRQAADAVVSLGKKEREFGAFVGHSKDGTSKLMFIRGRIRFRSVMPCVPGSSKMRVWFDEHGKVQHEIGPVAAVENYLTNKRAMQMAAEEDLSVDKDEIYNAPRFTQEPCDRHRHAQCWSDQLRVPPVA